MAASPHEEHMATVEERYMAATAYVRRAVDVVEERGITYLIDPVTGIVEWYAGKTKTQQPRNELTRIEARWLRTATDTDRAAVARDAELLADRVQESLPGAPQDRVRTNLYEGETPKGTPATSYAQEVAMQALRWVGGR
jgi:sugar phosphate isomerase/epimerase